MWQPVCLRTSTRGGIDEREIVAGRWEAELSGTGVPSVQHGPIFFAWTWQTDC